MAKKQFTVVSNVHLGKTPHTLIEGDKSPWNTYSAGAVFEAEESDVAKILAAGAIRPRSSKEPTPVIAESVEESQKRGKR